MVFLNLDYDTIPKNVKKKKSSPYNLVIYAEEQNKMPFCQNVHPKSIS